jgi:serine/threonine protein kinase
VTVSSLTIGRVLGHYRILEQIGAGGMGVVFRARDEQLDRDVALKTLPQLALLSDAARRQFRREALSLAKITDPHVAMAFDFGRGCGIDYLVTEYVSGLTLKPEKTRAKSRSVVSPRYRNSTHGDIRRRNAESNGVGGSARHPSAIDQGKLLALTRVVLPR